MDTKIGILIVVTRSGEHLATYCDYNNDFPSLTEMLHKHIREYYEPEYFNDDEYIENWENLEGWELFEAVERFAEEVDCGYIDWVEQYD